MSELPFNRYAIAYVTRRYTWKRTLSMGALVFVASVAASLVGAGIARADCESDAAAQPDVVIIRAGQIGHSRDENCADRYSRYDRVYDFPSMHCEAHVRRTDGGAVLDSFCRLTDH